MKRDIDRELALLAMLIVVFVPGFFALAILVAMGWI